MKNPPERRRHLASMDMQRTDTASSRSTTASGVTSRFTSPLREGIFARTPDTELSSPPHQPVHPHGPPISRPGTVKFGTKRPLVFDGRSPPKKRKQSPPVFGPVGFVRTNACVLPLDIWRLVIKFLSPLDLGRLVQVNRAFHGCLTDESSVLDSTLSISNSQNIWTISRRLHHPDLPEPPSECSEIELWRLLLSKRCQFCQCSSENNKVDIVWSFGIRSCRSCLESRTVKVGVIRPCGNEAGLTFTQ
jgi:hypothetical protein